MVGNQSAVFREGIPSGRLSARKSTPHPQMHGVGSGVNDGQVRAIDERVPPFAPQNPRLHA